jgi:hypothetical protein
MSSPFHMQEIDDDSVVAPKGASIPDEELEPQVTFVDIGSIQMNPATGDQLHNFFHCLPVLIEMTFRLCRIQVNWKGSFLLCSNYGRRPYRRFVGFKAEAT